MVILPSYSPAIPAMTRDLSRRSRGVGDHGDLVSPYPLPGLCEFIHLPHSTVRCTVRSTGLLQPAGNSFSGYSPSRTRSKVEVCNLGHRIRPLHAFSAQRGGCPHPHSSHFIPTSSHPYPGLIPPLSQAFSPPIPPHPKLSWFGQGPRAKGRCNAFSPPDSDVGDDARCRRFFCAPSANRLRA
jgi:hypothetical protein